MVVIRVNNGNASHGPHMFHVCRVLKLHEVLNIRNECEHGLPAFGVLQRLRQLADTFKRFVAKAQVLGVV